MASSLLTSLSFTLAVVLIYFTLHVQPQPTSVLVPPSPPRPLRPLRVETLPPPRNTVSSPPPPKNKTLVKHHKFHNNHNHSATPSSKQKLNLGKKIGLLFMGIVAILQVCVVAFLVIKSRQMFINQNSH